MTRDEHAFRRALALGFSFVEYPTGQFSFRTPTPSAPADIAEAERVRTHLRDRWPAVIGLVAVHLAEQRRVIPRFE